MVMLCYTPPRSSEVVIRDIRVSFGTKAFIGGSNALPAGLELRAVAVERNHDKYKQILDLLVRTLETRRDN